MSNSKHKAPRSTGFDTLALHAGQSPDPSTGARAVPIYQSASFVFPDSDFAAGLFNIERAGHVYSRLSNPTNAVLEERMAALEHGVGSIVTSSGQAAMHLGVATLMGAGDHIVSSRSLYGGTHNLLEYTLKRFGIETTFVDPRDLSAFRSAIRPNTKLLFGEILGNPGLEVLNVPELGAIAHEQGLPLMVDATFATPYLCKPIELGADLVMHSATKFLSGHGVVIGGVLVDGGTFDWEGSGKFPTLTEPYDGFHDLVFSEEFGPQAFITRARKEGIRDFGACMAPMTAFQILQGIETLPLRMDKHVSNTQAVVEYLADHPAVEGVGYPGMAAHPDYELGQSIMPKGCGAVFSFIIKGGREAGKTLIENLELFSHLANIGDAKSLIIHPASTTHHRMDAQALQAAGVAGGMVRVSVGLEDPSDLIADLKSGLRAVEKQVNS
ncbi:MAG: O-acetylhomoserine aminocarboxypropyltransferase [Pseudomonadota bacterium]|nr:O-acetylhomoserine aminocarboxypropyltransferase [Pseudomonadota bacterium]